MLTHFGTLFALCHKHHMLTYFNTINTPLLLLNFHKNNVSRGTVTTNVSRGTNEGRCYKCFTWNVTSVNNS